MCVCNILSLQLPHTFFKMSKSDLFYIPHRAFIKHLFIHLSKRMGFCWCWFVCVYICVCFCEWGIWLTNQMYLKYHYSRKIFHFNNSSLNWVLTIYQAFLTLRTTLFILFYRGDGGTQAVIHSSSIAESAFKLSSTASAHNLFSILLLMIN